MSAIGRRWQFSADVGFEPLFADPLAPWACLADEERIAAAGYAKPPSVWPLPILAVHPAVRTTPITQQWAFLVEITFAGSVGWDVFVADLPSLLALATRLRALRQLMRAIRSA